MSIPHWLWSDTCSVHDILGDHIVFRSLQPLDASLPGLRELRAELGIAPGDTPRKTTLGYAKVIHRILQKARAAAGLQRLIYLGDTFFNDGSAFRNIAAVSGWDAAGLITAENPAQPAMIGWHPTPGKVQRLFTANRWYLVNEFQNLLERHAFPIDEHTAVVIDLDKTLLGARGRNDRVIDGARLQAAYTTAAEIFDEFVPEKFGSIYDTLNQTTYHSLTADNQDFLVYICLLVYAGIPPLDEVIRAVETGGLHCFEDFETIVQHRHQLLSSSLRTMHEDFRSCRAAGDPTPFKRFRRNEYLNTIRAMQADQHIQDSECLMKESIVITAEVKAFADHCRSNGALLFAISDKPDEASLPLPGDAAQGYLPLHQVQAAVVSGLP